MKLQKNLRFYLYSGSMYIDKLELNGTYYLNNVLNIG